MLCIDAICRLLSKRRIRSGTSIAVFCKVGTDGSIKAETKIDLHYSSAETPYTKLIEIRMLRDCEVPMMPDHQDNPQDGGRTALAGFLYQLIGVLGMKAYAEAVPDGGAESEEFGDLVQLVRNGALYHEYFDQDAAVLTVPSEGVAGGWTLIQFKFSSHRPPTTIGPTEFRKILDRLWTSANAAGYLTDPNTQYMLVSNREYGREVKKIVADVPDHAGLNDNQKTIFGHLTKVQGPTLTGWEEHIRRFAEGYGCLSDAPDTNEIRGGIARVVLQLLESANRPATDREAKLLKTTDLVEAFTGRPDAHDLQKSRIRSFSEGRLNAFRATLALNGVPARRALLDEISREVFTNFQAIIILTGSGGNGKSVSLWHWALERLEESQNSEAVSPFVVISEANKIREDHLAHLVSAITNVRQRRHDSHDLALDRVSVANPYLQPPIICLGVDGIDSEFADRSDGPLQDLLAWCLEGAEMGGGDAPRPPAAVAIITCRDESEGLVLRRLLRIIADPLLAGLPVTSIPVPQFTEQDLIDAAYHAALGDLAHRIENGFGSQLESRSQVVGKYVPRTETTSSIRAADRVVIETLRHPAMWSAFMEIQDDAHRNVILDGDEGALGELAEHFISKFYEKASMRYLTARRDETYQALKHVATATPAGPYLRPLWLEITERYLRPLEALTLYGEADSYGLINRQAATWSWRHQFIRQYLESLPL
jgi:hypothetical protein